MHDINLSFDTLNCRDFQLIENTLKDFIIEALDRFGLVMKRDQNISLKSGVQDMPKENPTKVVIVFTYQLQEATSGEIQVVTETKVFCVKLMKSFVMEIIGETVKVNVITIIIRT